MIKKFYKKLNLKAISYFIVYLVGVFFAYLQVCYMFIQDAKKNGLYEYSNKKEIEVAIKELAEYCGTGYAVGWWRAEEISLTYRNVALYKQFCNSDKCEVKSIKQYNNFYQESHKFDFDTLAFLKLVSSKKDKPTVYACRNIKKCEHTQKPLFMELIVGATDGYKNKQYTINNINQLKDVFTKTNFPILDFTYTVITDKQEDVYNLFHISNLDINNVKCDIETARLKLQELTRGLD